MNFTDFQTIHILGGDCAVSSDPNALMITVLGSCISACIYDPVAQVGGMNHFVLPTTGDCEPQPRYGDVAMRTLVDELYTLGADRRRLRAKLYGGRMRDKGGRNTGSANSEFAKRFLASEGIELVGASIGDDLARWIKFHPVTGKVWLKVSADIAPPIKTRISRRA